MASPAGVFRTSCLRTGRHQFDTTNAHGVSYFIPHHAIILSFKVLKDLGLSPHRGEGTLQPSFEYRLIFCRSIVRASLGPMSTRGEVDAFVSFLHRTFIEKGITKAGTTSTLSNRPKLKLMPKEQVVEKRTSEATLVTQGPPSRG